MIFPMVIKGGKLRAREIEREREREREREIKRMSE